MKQAGFTWDVYIEVLFYKSESSENEDMPGGMDFAKVLTVTVQGNGHYSWSASPLLRSLCLSSRKGSVVVTERSLL